MAGRDRKAEDDKPTARIHILDAPEQRRISVSDSLRGRRIECGLEIDYVAQILRIRPAVLIAIESGKFDELPGPAYAVGFVRSYATYLGLDAEALVLRFKSETTEIARRPHLEFPLPIRDSRVPTGPLLIICILLAVITYGGWYYLTAKPGQLAELTPAVPERLLDMLKLPPPQKEAPKPAPADTAPAAVAPQTAPAATTTATAVPPPVASPVAAPAAASTAVAPPPQVAQVTTAAAPAPSSPAPAAPQPAAPAAAAQTSVDGVPPVENQAGAAPVVAALPPSPDLTQPAISGDAAKGPGDNGYGAPDGQARVVLHATADSWVQVRDKGSNLLFTRVLKSGEHYNVPNQPGLTLIAGNAGGLDITVDGMAAPHIGEVGRVARNVSLDPDHLLGAVTHAN